MQVVKRSLLLPLLALLIGCAGAQQQGPVSRIDRVQAGDNNLTCAELRAQIATMDKAMADAKASQDAATAGVSTASAGGTAAAVGTGLLGFIPVVGGIASAGVGIATGQAAGDQAQKGAQAMQDAEDAHERKMALVSLANAKGCFAAAAK